MRRWGVLLVMAALMLPVGFLAGSPGGQALARQDAPGCEGLSAYREAMYGVGRHLNDTSAAAGLEDRNIFTYSSDDWTVYAGIALEGQRQLKAITPPDFAADYHRNLIATFGLFEQIGRAAASDGPTVLSDFSDQIDEVNQRNLDTTAAAAAICADFQEVADTWGSQSSAPASPVAAASVEATATEPAAEPSPTPAVQSSATSFETAGTGGTGTDIFMIPGTYLFQFECDTPGGTAGIYVPWLGPETIYVEPTGTRIEFPDTGSDRSQALLLVKCDGSWTLTATP